MSRLDKALAELAAEKPEETKPTEPKPEETQVEQPTETPEEKHEDKPEEHEQPAEPTEEKPEEKADEPKPKKEIPDDPMKRAEYSFRRQLDKNNKKHADELAARDKEIAELKARFAEIEKKTDPNNAPKTRKDFENDDDYIDYLTQRRVDKILAERDAEAKKKGKYFGRQPIKVDEKQFAEESGQNEEEVAQPDEQNDINIEALFFTEEGRVIFRNGLLRGIIHKYAEIDDVVGKIQDILLKGVKFTLVYKAFDVGDRAKTFHEKCDKLKMSLVLIETDKDVRF